MHWTKWNDVKMNPSDVQKNICYENGNNGFNFSYKESHKGCGYIMFYG